MRAHAGPLPAARRSLRMLSAVMVTFAAGLPAQFFDRAAVTSASISADAQVVAYTLRAPAAGADRFEETVYHLPSAGGTPQELGPGSAAAFAPVGTAIARLAAGALLVRETLSGTDRNVSGDALQVHAFRWSPDGARIAFVAESAGSVTTPRALYVVDAGGGEPRRLTPADFSVGPAAPELPGLVEFDWLSPARLVISGRAADATDGPHAASLHIVDLASGATRYLAGKDGRWHLPVVSPNGEWIAFTGQALGPAGWMASELIVIRPDGTGLRRLTAGRDLDALDITWATDSRTLWFAVEERGTRNLLKVDSRNSRITPGTAGNHLIMLQAIARRGDWALALRATATSPGALIRFPLGKPHEMVVLHEPEAAGFAGEIEELDLTVPGTGNMHGWLLRPPQFDATRRYPLLVEIHGGPHAMAGAGYAPFALAHAADGWLVMRLNPRGSTGFGFDLSNGLGDRWPGRDVEDLQAAIAALVERGLVDSTQLALAGTGAGAAVAMALRASTARVAATILRCADGDWLMGGSGVDRPMWNEWHAARPFPRLAAEWWRSFGAVAAAPSASPLLVIEGSGGAPRAATLSEMMHAAAGNASRFVRVQGGCREAGPQTQEKMLEAERELLEGVKD